MANILDTYGIKEVADVTIYEIKENSDGSVSYNPVLLLDTLKVSTIEQTAEQVSARGGKGNPELIIWDYGKEITLNLEDALFSPQSMNIMFGGMKDKQLVPMKGVNTLTRMKKYEVTETTTVPAAETGEKWYSTANFDLLEAGTTVNAGTFVYCEKTYESATSFGQTIEITAANFPGTYRIVGETYARSQKTGQDEFFQFEIPKAKMGAENTITLEAEGDPTVFNMTMKVLRPDDGVMIKLTQFNLPDESGFRISLNANGGTWAANQTSSVVTGANGKLAAMPSDPATGPDGKTFSGWNTAADGSGTTITTDTVFAENSTIYAIWTE